MSIAGCPMKRARPRLRLGLINQAYLLVQVSVSEVELLRCVVRRKRTQYSEWRSACVCVCLCNFEISDKSAVLSRSAQNTIIRCDRGMVRMGVRVRGFGCGFRWQAGRVTRGKKHMVLEAFSTSQAPCANGFVNLSPNKACVCVCVCVCGVRISVFFLAHTFRVV